MGHSFLCLLDVGREEKNDKAFKVAGVLLREEIYIPQYLWITFRKLKKRLM